MATRRTRERREKKRKVVSARRYAEEHKGGFQSRCFKVPESTRIFMVDKEGVRKISIIPYTVADNAVGELNLYGRPGELHFERTYFAHRDTGPDGEFFPCLKKTFDKPCPICDFRASLLKDSDADEKLIKNLAPKERQLWNVFDHDNPDRGVQLWEYSYHLFGKQLKARVDNSDEEDGYEFFHDPEDGMMLKVGFGEESFGSNTFYVANSIDFRRREPLDDEILDAALCLDDVLVDMDYDKLKNAFRGITEDSDEVREPEEEDEQEETPKRRPKSSQRESAKKSSSAKTAEDDSEPKKSKSSGTTKTASRSKDPTAEKLGIEVNQVVDHDDHGECSVIRISKDGLKVEVLDSEDEKHTVKPSELTIVEFEDEEEEQEETAEDEPEEEEEDDDDDWDDFEDD